MLAIQALAFIAEDPERMGAFLARDRHRARARSASAAGSPDFLAGVLEHMLGDEGLLLAFADSRRPRSGRDRAGASALGGEWERDLPCRSEGLPMSYELLPRLPRRRRAAKPALRRLRLAATAAP